MDNNDKAAFSECIRKCCLAYGKVCLDVAAIELWLAVFAEYSIDQFKGAIFAHVKESKFLPTIAEITAKLEGGNLTNDEIIASARLAVTPFGVLARKHIGKHDLDNGNAFNLKERAAEVSALMAEWKKRAIAGGYTDSELLMMKRFNVNPQMGFIDGMQPIKIENINERLAQIEYDRGRKLNGMEEKLLLEAPEASESTKEEIEKMKQMFNFDNEIH